MEMLQHLKRLFHYDSWANKETISSIKAAAITPTTSVRFMNHIVGAEQLWFSRIKEQPSPIAVWPDLDISECEIRCADLSRSWSDYIDDMNAGELAQSVSYLNSKNEPWTSKVEDILMHVVMHSAYHRGQIASDMRRNALVPAYTDYIHSIRSGLVE